MSVAKQVQHWKLLANRDWRTAQGLFDLKRYDACLFFCHLSIEKFLKGLIIHHTGQTAPFTHDLERLALLAELDLSDEFRTDLKDISVFNIAARYSDYRHSFYKKCTSSYTRKYISRTEVLVKWLRKKYPRH